MADAQRDVLVVEDDAEINELVGAYVEMAGFRYRRAMTGAEAVRRVNEAPPSLVVLDIMLPDQDGFEVCRQIKSDPTTAAVPVVMLTALDRAELREQGLQCGAVEYLTKPFDPDRLMQIIRDRARRNGNHKPTP